MKVPFEKLGSAARKQTNAFQHKFPPHDEVEDSQNEEAKHEPHHHVSLHHLGHRTTQHARRASTAPHPSFQPLAHQHPRLFRREAVGSVTDEERGDREFHLRKLFLKGQRPQLEYARPRRSDASDVAKAEQRHIELRHLESALARESAFRQRQAEVDRRTQLEAETRERIALIEGEIYQERLQ